MNFSEIEDLIRKNIINGAFPLSNDDINLSLLFGKEIPVFINLVIKDVVIKFEEFKSITIDGTVDILSYEDLDIELKFKYEGKDDELKDIITYSLNVLLPPNKKGNLLYSFGNHFIKNMDIPELIPLSQIEFSNFLIEITPAKSKIECKMKSQSDWEIPIGFKKLKLSEIELSLTRQQEKEEQEVQEKEGTKFSGTFGGNLEIDGVIIAIKSEIPGKFELQTTIPTFNLSNLLQDLCGPITVQNSHIPIDFLELEIRNLSFVIVINEGIFQFKISGESKKGKVEFFIGQVFEKEAQPSESNLPVPIVSDQSPTPNTTKPLTTEQPPASSTTKKKIWAFVIGFSPPETFKFSEINLSLGPLDELKLSNIDLILSSTELESKDLPTIGIGRSGDFAIKKGVNLFVDLNLTGTDIDKLIGIEKLALTGQIGFKPFSLLLSISIGGKINIANILELQNVNFEINIPPLSLALRTQMALQLGKDLLLITSAAKFSLKDTLLNFAGTIKGTWNEPLGFKGVTIEDVALELGINFKTIPIPLPVIGFAGTLKVGDFYGSGAIKINPSDPTQCMLLINFNKLFLKDVIKLCCDPVVINKFPQGFLELVNIIGFEKVNIYLVPTIVYIGELRYDPGFAIKGFMHFLNWNAIIDLRLDYEKGIKIYGKFDPIEIPGLFLLRGANGTQNPLVDISLYMGESPHFYISGSLEILGIKGNTDISIDENGFKFRITGKVFKLFDGTLLIEGSDFRKLENIRIRGVIHNNILNMIKDGLINAIKSYADGTNNEISVLIKEVDKAQAKVNDLDKQIANLTEEIKKERKIASENLKKARKDLQNEIEKLAIKQKPVDDMRKKIEAERSNANKDLNNKIKDVEKAQNAVDDLSSEINSKKRRIRNLKEDISDLEKRRKKRNCNLKCAIDCTNKINRKNAEITDLYFKIGSLELQRVPVLVVLEGAKRVLKAVRGLIVSTPIELDPRMVAFIAARDIAAAAMAVVEGLVVAAEKLIVNTPIELDPRIVPLISLRETALLALNATELALKTFKAGADTLLNAAIDIINVGFDNIFNIRSVWFDTKLNAASGGIIPLKFDVVFRQKSHKIMYEFDFKDVVGSYARLGHQIISGKLEYAPEAKVIEIKDLEIY